MMSSLELMRSSNSINYSKGQMVKVSSGHTEISMSAGDINPDLYFDLFARIPVSEKSQAPRWGLQESGILLAH